jgi:hypothetical protein
MALLASSCRSDGQSAPVSSTGSCRPWGKGETTEPWQGRGVSCARESDEGGVHAREETAAAASAEVDLRKGENIMLI